MKFTKAIEKKYLKNPHFCPKCNHNKIVADGFDGEAQFQTVYCDGCGFVWREIFEMVGIEPRR